MSRRRRKNYPNYSGQQPNVNLCTIRKVGTRKYFVHIRMGRTKFVSLPSDTIKIYKDRNDQELSIDLDVLRNRHNLDVEVVGWGE